MEIDGQNRARLGNQRLLAQHVGAAVTEIASSLGTLPNALDETGAELVAQPQIPRSQLVLNQRHRDDEIAGIVDDANAHSHLFQQLGA